MDHLQESPFFTQNEALRLRQREVLATLRILLQPRTIGLISGQAVERDQTPRDVIGALVWKKIPDEMASTARDDAAPIFRVLLESIALEGIDLIADEAGD